MSVFQSGNIAYGFSQALVGVFPPPIISQRNPTTGDKASIGTVWINEGANDPFILASIVDNIATWVNLNASVAINAIVTDDGTAFPVAGIINLLGGANIVTSASGNTVDVAVTPNINLPATNAAGTQGVYQIGGFNFLYAFPPSSTFVGTNAGSTGSNSLLAINNVGVGKSALSGITTGNSNTAVGQAALASCTTGLNNVALGNLSMNAITTGDTNISLGNQALESITTGNDNIALGFAAGINYTGSESSNIIIGNSGILSESHVIRIGQDGSGTAQQDECFIAGIYNRTYGSTNQVMFVDSTGKLGSSEGTDGQLLISSSSVSPAWANLTAGSGITITNASNSITVASTITQGIVTIDGNTGSVTGTTVTIEGGNNILTSGSGSTLVVEVAGTTQHALLIGNSSGSINSLAVATNGQLPIGSTGADPVLATITAGSGINVTNGAGSIAIANTQTQGIVTINGNSGSVTGTTITIQGGNNITTSGSGTILTANVSGTTNHAVQIGNSTNSLSSVAVGTTGQVLIGSTGADPAFGALGVNSGLTAHGVLIGENNSAIVATAVGSTGQVLIGSTGADPAFGALGVNSGLTAHSLVLSQNNSAFTALGAATNGQIPIGSTGADPVLATITQGSGITVTNGAGSITIAATGAGSISTLAGDTGSATGSTVTVAGGSNINTSATASTLTVNLNSNVGISGNFTTSGGRLELPASTASQGYISVNGNVVLQSRGTGNIFLGPLSGNIGAVSGQFNTGVGTNALAVLTSGNNNISVGISSLMTLTTGSTNTAVGQAALGFLTTGSFNTCIGDGAGENYTGAETSNICISNLGVVSESNVIRIGTQGTGSAQQNACYIAGIAGVTVASSGAVLINTSTGQLGTVVSSRRYKQSINPMDDASSNVLDLNPVTFTYKNDPTHERKYGLIAEEVESVFPDLVLRNKAGDPDSVKYHDLPVLLLNELQKQHNIIAELSRRLDRLEGRSQYESKS